MKKILSTIFLISVLSFSLFTGCDKKEENVENNNNNENSVIENEYEKEKVVYELNSESDKYRQAVTDLTLTYNGKTLKYPFKLKDIETLGIEIDESYLTKNIPSNSGLGNIRVYVPNEIIVFNVKNTTSTDLPASECIVNYASTNNENFTINGITPNKSTYADALKLFGRDVEKRKNIYKNELLRQEKEDDSDEILNYSTKDKNQNFTQLTLSFDTSSTDGKIYNVTYYKIM